MELTLNIYDRREVVKTYTADTYDVMFGTIEDFINVIDFDSIKKGTEDELIKVVAQALPKVISLIKPLLRDIFPDLTDEEIKKCKVSEIARVIVNLVVFTLQQVASDNQKNA